MYLFYYIDTDEIPAFFQWRKFGIQWRYNFYLSHVKISRLSWLLQSQPIENYHHSSAHLPLSSQIILKTKMAFSDQLPNFAIDIFDDEQNERIDGRFVPMTDSEVDNLIEMEENANTKRKTLFDINFVKQFLTEHGERRSTEEIPAVKLNNYLNKFIVAARTKRGEEYEPSSLRGILLSVECHLRRAGYYQRQRFSKDTRCPYSKTERTEATREGQ